MVLRSLRLTDLDLVVTWLNIFPLFSFSDKFAVPYLRRACITFLRASLAGRPIEAMALGERHGIEDVYREASRHVLDNMPSWSHDELAVLTSDTLLKVGEPFASSCVPESDPAHVSLSASEPGSWSDC